MSDVSILDAIWDNDLTEFQDLYTGLSGESTEEEPEQQEGDHVEMFDEENDVVFLADVDGIEEIPDRNSTF